MTIKLEDAVTAVEVEPRRLPGVEPPALFEELTGEEDGLRLVRPCVVPVRYIRIDSTVARTRASLAAAGDAAND